MLEKQTTQSVDFEELLRAAEIEAKKQTDIAQAKQLYIKAAARISDKTNNNNVVRGFDFGRLRKISRSIVSHIADKEFEKKIYIYILERTRSKEEYVMVAQLVSLFLKDHRFSEKICRHIEIIFLSKKKLEFIFKKQVDGIRQLTPQTRISEIHKFLQKYKMNRFIKDFHFKAGKEFARIDRMESLKAFAMYYALSRGEETKTELIPTRVKNLLFENEKQYNDFMKMTEMAPEESPADINTGMEVDTHAAAHSVVKSIVEYFTPKRKTIQLDPGRIDDITNRHSETVDTLNEILEEPEESKPPPTSTPLNLQQALASPIPGNSTSGETTVIAWEPVEKEFLQFFSQYNFAPAETDVIEFARQKQVFANQLINRINERFSDTYDDVLIEENDGQYRIAEEYMNILKQSI